MIASPFGSRPFAHFPLLMPDTLSIKELQKPIVLFCIGFAAVMLALTIAIPPVWTTFIHSWRVELTAAVFLLVTLAAAAYFKWNAAAQWTVSSVEIKLIVLPISAFICWSALSMIWAASWRSSLHHTLVWSEYLIFFLLVRHFLETGRNYSKLVTTAALCIGFFGVLATTGYCTFLAIGTGTKLGIVYAKFGEQANTIFPLVLAGVLTLSGRKFAAGTALLAFLWLLDFCSLSRINILLFAAAAVFAVGVVFAFKRFRPYRRKLAIVAVVLIAVPIPLHVFNLFSDDAGIPMVRRVTDDALISSSNNFRKLMLSISEEMIVAHPLIGIGADNFGFETNAYRASYAARNLDDIDLAQAESEIPERAHNEYVQIFAELGIVGVAVFIWFMLGIGYTAVRIVRDQRGRFLHGYAALLGLALFLASSTVSSYSFRLVQNGFVFFFVLAVAAKLAFRQETSEIPMSIPAGHSRFRLAVSCGMIACVLMIGYCTVRVASVMYATQANYTTDLDAAMPLYQKAIALDSENPEAPYFYGMRLFSTGRYSEAVPLLQRSIDIGKARSEDYSYLASAQSISGDNAGAERTFTSAVRLYPRSPFVLTRYAALLRASGKNAESVIPLDLAKEINARQANTWWEMLTESPQAAADLAVVCEDYVPLMDLLPQPAMMAVKAEREIRFPKEKFKF